MAGAAISAWTRPGASAGAPSARSCPSSMPAPPSSIPRLFADCPDGAFSLNLLFNRAIEAERFYGVRMDGLWLHVGTPEAIAEAEMSVADSAA